MDLPGPALPVLTRKVVFSKKPRLPYGGGRGRMAMKLRRPLLVNALSSGVSWFCYTFHVPRSVAAERG